MKRFGLKLVEPIEAAAPAAEAGRRAFEAPSHAFVRRLESREPEALTELYRAHERSLRALARRLLGEAPDAEDLVHDVFVALPRALRRYAGDSSLENLLCGMVVNLARRRLRAFGRLRRAVARALEGRSAQDMAPSDPGSLEQRELALRLTAALDRLPFPQRAAVVLCLVEERSAAEAGAILGVPEGTVRTRLFYGRKRLQTLLCEPGGGGA